MFGFLKRLMGLPTEEEILAAKKHKIDPVIINNKTGDVVDIPFLDNSQITDSVTIKKPRKPRTPKEKTSVKEKSTRGRKPVAKKVQK